MHRSYDRYQNQPGEKMMRSPMPRQSWNQMPEPVHSQNAYYNNRNVNNRASRYMRIPVPADRVQDHYRRSDYGYDHDEDPDTFTVRRPNSAHLSEKDLEGKMYSIRGSSRSTLDSPNADRKSVRTPVSRPGSPGPVAGPGDIVNTEHGFTIQLDVKHFTPQQIKVLLTDDLLCVSGERIEETPDGQTLRRSFSRKYSIPVDIQLDSIRSHLTDNGFLLINGSRRGWKETTISYHPMESRRNGRQSVISTV